MKHVIALLVGLSLCTALPVAAQDSWRIEGAYGVCKHSLANEGSWHYDGYEKNMQLRPACYQFGASWLRQTGAWGTGLRLAYVDLGKVKADNEFPIVEDGGPDDHRVNNDCQYAKTGSYARCKGRFQGEGSTYGISLGPIVERNLGPVTLGAETGVYSYRSSWVVRDGHVQCTSPDCSMSNTGEWDYARGTHQTWYAGASARVHWLTVGVRRYANVHASQAAKNPGYIGMTSGPVWQFAVGGNISF